MRRTLIFVNIICCIFLANALTIVWSYCIVRRVDQIGSWSTQPLQKKCKWSMFGKSALNMIEFMR